MAVNACAQDSLTQALQQGAEPLAVRYQDGSVLMHRALAASYFPSLALVTPASVTVQPDETTSSPHQPVAQHGVTHYELEIKRNRKQGRTWASRVRRFMRDAGYDRYKAMQTVASEAGVPVTDVRLLVEFSNKATKARGRAIRQAILWKWHCEGSSHRASADRFPFPLHEKTVATDIREILQQQHGGTRNVR